MMRLAPLVLVLPLLVLVPACGDDDPTDPSPAPAHITIRVVDTGGDPVADLAVGLMHDGVWLQDALHAPVPTKPNVTVPFTMARTGHAVVTVEDIEGGHVRTLFDAMAAAGRWHVVWDGHDDGGERAPSGRYTMRFVAREEGGEEKLCDETVDVLLATMTATVGTTDADGELLLRDRRLFPHLYDRPDMTIVDEAGDPQGALVLGSRMRVYLSEPGVAGSTRHFIDVYGHIHVFDLVWDPTQRRSLASGPTATPARRDAGVPPDGGFELRHPYPNPFN